MASGISRIWMRTGMLLGAALLVLNLTACGDKEGDQRKAFIDFLQNTVMRWRQTLVRQIDFNPFDPRDSVKNRATNIHFGQLDRASQLLGIGYLYVENTATG